MNEYMTEMRQLNPGGVGAIEAQMKKRARSRRIGLHRLNPNKDDYALFQQQVESELREEALGKWIEKRIGESFVRIDAPYKACAMDMPWLTQSINAQR